jgi:hypothetical protein
VATASALLAHILWHAGERSGAVAQQARAVVLLERLLGPDHVDVALAHGNLAAYLAVRDGIAARDSVWGPAPTRLLFP